MDLTRSIIESAVTGTSTPTHDEDLACRIREIRENTWKFLDREYQIAQLELRTREFVLTEYAENKRVVERLNSNLDYIFGDTGVARIYKVPERIGQLQSQTPCIFTFFPGAGTHESLSQYDVVASPRYSRVHTRDDVELASQLTRSSNTHISAPLTVANMQSTISTEMAEIMVEQGLIPIFHRFRRPLNPADCDTNAPTVQSLEDANAEKLSWAERFGERAFFSCGVQAESIRLTQQLIRAGAGGVVVDIALGNSEMAVSTVIQLKDFINKGGYSAQIIAGNVDSAEGYLELALAGADCVKVGIGPGSPCTTRGVTRAGTGQGSALMNIARAQFVLGPEAPRFIADGGIEGSSDVLLALILGASAVMTGKLAARTMESAALKKEINGQMHAWYFGAASKWARIYERGGVKSGMAVEGEGKWIPCSGLFLDLLNELRGGLRNALPYYNACNIGELQHKFSIPQQLCDLILGDTTGIYKSSSGTGAESGTRLH